MNLAQVIHQRWAAAEALNDLLPTSRVFTGLSPDPTTPYAVITKADDSPGGAGGPAAYCNDGSAVDRVRVRIEVFHDDRAAAAAIMHQIKVAFDRSDFALAGSDRVVNMQRSHDSERQEKDGLWRLVIDFDCTVYLASGV